MAGNMLDTVLGDMHEVARYERADMAELKAGQYLDGMMTNDIARFALASELSCRPHEVRAKVWAKWLEERADG